MKAESLMNGGSTNGMIKSYETITKQERPVYKIPHRVQDIIPIDCIYKDGIFRCGQKFTKSFLFSDINFMVASEDDKQDMLEKYAAFLNSLDGSATTKLTINNHKFNRRDFEKALLMPLRGDTRDVYRREHNKMLIDKASSGNGIIQEKYITVSVAKKNIDDARRFFGRIESEFSSRLKMLGSKFSAMSTEDRLKVLHNFYRIGEEEHYYFDMDGTIQKGHDFRDYICPDAVEKNADYLMIGNKYARVLFLKSYANIINDDFVTKLTDYSRTMMLSIDIVPVSTEEAIRDVESKLLGVETNITNWQRKQNQNNNFSAIVPYDMDLQRTEARTFLDDLVSRDQRMLMAVLTMVHVADTKEKLDEDTNSFISYALENHFQIAALRYQQIAGLQTVLPIGVRRIDAIRTHTTEALSIFMPFKVQEIQDKGGIYYGENAESHNLIFCNRENLLNQSGILLGVPGSGKSFCAKGMIYPLILNSDDDILICDPEGEYAPLVEAMGTDIGTVIKVAAGGRDRLNAMYMVDGYGDNDPLVVKTQFIMSLIEQIDKGGVGPKHRSIIDRCMGDIYRRARKTRETPTLTTLREELMKQPEDIAQEIALSLELYTVGSLDIFGHDSNVDLNKRVIVFDIHDLGAQLKPAGLLVITDTMLNRVSYNWKRGKRTHIFIDEYHVVYENEYSAAFFDSAWRQFRKRNAQPTAITQNVDFLLESPQARAMLSNSEFLVMLSQAPQDRFRLADLLNIDKAQLGYITNAEAGSGLIKYGSSLVPFVNRFPKDTKLYELMTTKPGEGAFAR